MSGDRERMSCVDLVRSQTSFKSYFGSTKHPNAILHFSGSQRAAIFIFVSLSCLCCFVLRYFVPDLSHCAILSISALLCICLDFTKKFDNELRQSRKN